MLLMMLKMLRRMWLIGLGGRWGMLSGLAMMWIGSGIIWIMLMMLGGMRGGMMTTRLPEVDAGAWSQ